MAYGLTKTISRTKDEPSLPKVLDFVTRDLSEIERIFDDDTIMALVREDYRERDEHGMKKYGVPLRPFDGNNPLVEAYQEILDAAIYMRQDMMEQRIADDPEYTTILHLLFSLRERIHARCGE